jgi:hypothetical protein
MEIRDSLTVNGKGVFTTQKYKKDDIIFVLSGQVFTAPTRETIHVGNNVHIYDNFGIFINHSFTPNIYINGTNVTALRDIEIDEELAFNYNHNEINMASPFYVNNVLVNGKIV